jgi:DNA repair exonuclease SbcCD ATPase subunit
VIESIQLHNFQRWKKLLLEFDKRVTTIIGQTEAGKSTVLRALLWATLNQFPGKADQFIHWKANFATVKLRVDDHLVRRHKGTTNSYKLDDKEFRAFGANKVPDPVANLLRITEANFQAQLDQHFWISQSAGEISRQLNQIVNLGSIDDTLSNVATQARRARAEVEICEKRLDEAVKLRSKLSWAEEADRRLLLLEKRLSRISFLDTLASRLTATCKRLAQSRTTARLAGRQAYIASGLVKTADRIIDRDKTIKKLSKLIVQYGKAKSVLGVKIKAPPNPKILVSRAEKIDRLQNLIDKLSNEEKKCQALEATATASAKKLSTMLKGNCPICGKRLKVS